jgi:alkylation response protein AidB-like acyl-CoA dehydrogenase
MSRDELAERLEAVRRETLPLPGDGATAERLRRLFELGREDLTLAKLAEAHFDALAILAGAGREAAEGKLYAVWASEIPGKALALSACDGGLCIEGVKAFCSGAGLVERALITVAGGLMVEVDLEANAGRLEIDLSGWTTEAFRLTNTAAVRFCGVEVARDAVLGEAGWYVERAGFWHGACGPAACWAGGVAGLLPFARASRREDPHTLAHFAAMDASVWGMQALLGVAGREIDAAPGDIRAAQVRALRLRHLVEQACTETLQRFARAYGPYPISLKAEMARRYREADLYLRQCHGERDLESLSRLLRVLPDGPTTRGAGVRTPF